MCGAIDIYTVYLMNAVVACFSVNKLSRSEHCRVSDSGVHVCPFELHEATVWVAQLEVGAKSEDARICELAPVLPISVAPVPLWRRAATFKLWRIHPPAIASVIYRATV